MKRSKLLLGTGVGLLAGALFGALFAAMGEEPPPGSDPMFSSRTEEMEFAAVLLAVPGAVIGAGIGILSGKDKTIHFEGKSSEEIKVVREKLRAQARVTDFQ